MAKFCYLTGDNKIKKKDFIYIFLAIPICSRFFKK